MQAENFSCPVEATLSLIGGKYKPLILWHLIEQPLHYMELPAAHSKGHSEDAFAAAPGSSAKRNGFQRSNTGKSSKDNLFFNILWEKHCPRFGGYV